MNLNYLVAEPPIIEASRQGNINKLKKILNSGTDINSINYNGQTAIHKACVKGHTNIVKYLLSLNANCYIKDIRGWTPSESAKKNKHTDLSRLIDDYLRKNKDELGKETCCICMENTVNINLNCNHQFCDSCINKLSKKICPLCRLSF